MAAPKSDPAPGPLASRLQKIMSLKRKPNTRDTYTQLEIAQACSRLYVEDKISELPLPAPGDEEGQKVYERAVEAIRTAKPLLTRQYVSDLCTGRRDNPTHAVTKYLAAFFGVKPDYFFSGDYTTTATRMTEADIELMMLVRDFKEHLEDGGQKKGGAVLAQLMRRGGQLSPDTAMGMLLMQLAAIDAATEHGQ